MFQRSFAVAEYGLNNEVSNWDRGRNISMAVGGIDSTRRYVANGDTAFVKITKLNDNTFWVVSEGQANMGINSMISTRRTNAYVRIGARKEGWDYVPLHSPAFTVDEDALKVGAAFFDCLARRALETYAG